MEKAGKDDQQNNPKKASEKNDFVYLNSNFEDVILRGNFSGLINTGVPEIPSTPSLLIPSPPPWQC